MHTAAYRGKGCHAAYVPQHLSYDDLYCLMMTCIVFKVNVWRHEISLFYFKLFVKQS